jgi:hypothetical protein
MREYFSENGNDPSDLSDGSFLLVELTGIATAAPDFHQGVDYLLKLS